MKLLTLNTHSLVEKYYYEKLQTFVQAVSEEQPDIIALQAVNQTIIEMPGKIATFVFYAVMIVIIAVGPDIGIFEQYFVLPNWAMIALVGISVVLTIIAFLSYLPDTFTGNQS